MRFSSVLGEISPEGLLIALKRFAAVLGIVVAVLEVITKMVTKGNE